MGLTLDWLTPEARKFISLDNGYLRDQTPEERYEQICDNIGKIANSQPDTGDGRVKDISERFRRYVSNGWVSFASPVLANFGHHQNLPISCNFGMVSDSLDSILNGLRETGMLSKYGAGVAMNFSEIRPIGSKISSGGVSEGIMPFISLYEALIEKVSQNGVRRGFLTAYLSADHPEILSFLDIGSDGYPIKLITTGVTIPKGWMSRLKAGDSNCRKIWAKILKQRAEIGYPYILFEENCNINSPQVYRDKGYWLYSSNICVTGDQRVVTDKGLLTAKALYESQENLTVFDGKKPVSSSPMRLIERDADVFRVTLENGMTHDITSYHKVAARLGDSKQAGDTYSMVKCSDLTTDHQVLFQNSEGLFGKTDMQDEAYIFGLWQGDGTAAGNSIRISVWENDFDLIPKIQQSVANIWNKYPQLTTRIGKGTQTRPASMPRFTNSNTGTSTVAKKSMQSTAFSNLPMEFSKERVPQFIWEGTKETQWQYIKGIFEADGTAGEYNSKNSYGNPVQISLSSIHKPLLKEIQIILANLGVATRIHLMRPAGKQLLPDGKGGNKEYSTQDCWRLIASNKNQLLKFDENTGFLSRKGVLLEKRNYRDNSKKFSKVVSVEYIGKQDVYCLTVDSEEHVWTCNGIITSNCSEVLGYCDEKTTFACCLSAVVLPYYNEWKNDPDFIFDMNVMLDCVMEEYIRKASNMPGMGRAVKFAKEHRTIGLGVLGFHSLLQKNSIPIGSLECYSLNNEIFSLLREKSDEASYWMAEKWGEPSYLKGYGQRNASRLCCMPTKSTSTIAGGYSLGIEPIKSNYHVKKLAKSMEIYKNPELIPLLESYNKNNKSVWESVLNNNGSVQHLDFLTDNEKDVFKTFSEVSQADLISLAAQRQKYIDQGQSLNLMFHPETPPKEINKLLLEAYDKGIKTLYYQYSISAAQEFNKKLLQCSACEG